MSTPKPRCKPGDLAFITAVGPKQKKFLGLIVKVTRRAPVGPFNWGQGKTEPASALPRWRVITCDGKRGGWWFDHGLRPIRGDEPEPEVHREEADHV